MYDNDDYKFALELLEIYPSGINYLSERLQKSLTKLSLLKGWKDFDQLDEDIESDRELLLKILENDIRQFEKLSEKAKSHFSFQELLQLPSADFDFAENLTLEQIKSIDRQVILDAINNRNIVTENFVICFRNDREICLQSIKQFRFLVRDLRDVIDFDWNNDQQALDAILNSKNTKRGRYDRRHGHLSVLECLPHLNGNRDFVMKIINHDPKSFEYCSVDLKTDKDIAIRAISQDEYMIDYVHSSLLNDRTVIMTAITKNGQFLGKASEDLRSDRNVVLIALKASYPDLAPQYIPKSLWTDPEIRELMIKMGHITNLATLNFSREEVIWCLSANGFFIPRFAKYFTDEEVLKCCVRKHVNALREIPEKYRTFNVLMEAVKQDAQALRFVPNDCPFLDTLVMVAVKTGPPFSFVYYLNSATSFSVEQFKEIIMENDLNGASYGAASDVFKFAPEQLMNDREFVLSCVKRNGMVFNGLSPELQADPIIRKEAIKHGLKKKSFIPLK